MFNNMENRDLYFKNENESKNKKKGIWIILLYIFIILFLLICVYVTASNFLNATIKPNEMIVPGDNDDDKNNDKVDVEDNNNNNNNGGILNQIFNKGNIKLKVTFREQNDIKIRMCYKYPISEKAALVEDNMIKFSIKNLNGNASYKLSLRDANDKNLEEKFNNSRIKHGYLNYYLKNLNTDEEFRGKLSDLDVLDSYMYSDKIKKGETVNFLMAIWIDEDTGNEVQNSFYIGKLYVDVEGE